MGQEQDSRFDFKFASYTEPELICCGDEFLESCKIAWHKTGSEVWTEHVLNWFSHTAPADVRVDSRPARSTGAGVRNSQGEWLVDLVHTTYPLGNHHPYWAPAMTLKDDRAWSVLLVLESEWGKSRSPSRTFEMILDDASKLTALRAAVKVLVTSATNSRIAHDATLEAGIVNLRRRTRDTTPWLWINLPNEKMPELCSYVMFGDRNGTVRHLDTSE
jgi:hypothetical protein